MDALIIVVGIIGGALIVLSGLQHVAWAIRLHTMTTHKPDDPPAAKPDLIGFHDEPAGNWEGWADEDHGNPWCK